MPKSKIIRLNQHGGKSLPKGPARDICEAVAALFKPHGLYISIQNSYGDEHWAVLAHLPQDDDVWAGVSIDGTHVLYDVYDQRENQQHDYIDDDGHLFKEECDISQFDPETAVAKLLAVLPRD